MFKYIVIISSFVYCLSNLTANTHSFAFCAIASKIFLERTPTNNCLASCWEIVLAPPLLFKNTTALTVALKSIPEWL